jgi:pyruvate-ferredoxin/flavodoxin oxidoreductase
MVHALDQQKALVASGAWPLYRYDPRRAAAGENPLQLDSKPPSLPLKSFAYNETRYTMLAHADPEAARRALARAEEDVRRRWSLYQQLAAMPCPDGPDARSRGNGAAAVEPAAPPAPPAAATEHAS